MATGLQCDFAGRLRRWVSLHQIGESAVPAVVQRLLRVSVIPDSAKTIAASLAPCAIEIELRGAVVRVREGMDAKTLRTVLDVLREPPR